tara:strand:+ start:110 stop:676 length:567 start_codon:yes stop_codon:yes gene_type:complete
MVIDALYRKYFQKSKIFLYPLLEIKRGTSVVPDETFLSWNSSYGPEDMKLVCTYATRTDKEYMLFESNVLLKHNRLIDYVKVDDKTAVVTFDFSDLEDDWNCFISGKYSQMKIETKHKILDFFDKRSGNYAYVSSYLFPEKHFETYANLLDVETSFLESVGELCDKPDLEKEKLAMEVADLENIKILD